MLHLIISQKDVLLAPKIITGKNYSLNIMLGFVADPIFQHIGRLEFEDTLKMGSMYILVAALVD